MEAPLPSNEASRLAALRSYDVLDTPAEQAYDDITRLAALICDVPVSLVTLIDDDRQWFKSKAGLEFTQTPREHSFCAHAILKPDDVMLVKDASLDQRFMKNPLVTADPTIRFYAGAPLVTAAGEALGTVCVMDRVPRELEPEKAQALKALARQVVAQLELRRARAQIQRLTLDQQQRQKWLEDLSLELAKQNTTDWLTGLGNRREFDRIVNEQTSRTERSHSPLALAIIDVDHFQSFNDEFGRDSGDEALRQVARMLQSQARTYDHAARYGDDEFAVILPDTKPGASMVVAERMQNAIQNFQWGHKPITVSIGVATTTTEQGSMTLVERAEKALYRAKRKGRNCVVHIGEDG